MRLQVNFAITAIGRAAGSPPASTMPPLSKASPPSKKRMSPSAATSPTPHSHPNQSCLYKFPSPVCGEGQGVRAYANSSNIRPICSGEGNATARSAGNEDAIRYVVTPIGLFDSRRGVLHYHALLLLTQNNPDKRIHPLLTRIHPVEVAHRPLIPRRKLMVVEVRAG